MTHRPEGSEKLIDEFRAPEPSDLVKTYDDVEIGGSTDGADRPADRNPQGLLRAGEQRDRRDWEVRGPYCEGWPVYHAIHDRDTGTMYAAAASEWHGSGVWRSSDLGESWELSSDGL